MKFRISQLTAFDPAWVQFVLGAGNCCATLLQGEHTNVASTRLSPDKPVRLLQELSMVSGFLEFLNSTLEWNALLTSVEGI